LNNSDADLPQGLSESLVDALKKLSFAKLYSHQAESYTKLTREVRPNPARPNILLTTPPNIGKGCYSNYSNIFRKNFVLQRACVRRTLETA